MNFSIRALKRQGEGIEEIDPVIVESDHRGEEPLEGSDRAQEESPDRGSLGIEQQVHQVNTIAFRHQLLQVGRGGLQEELVKFGWTFCRKVLDEPVRTFFLGHFFGHWKPH